MKNKTKKEEMLDEVSNFLFVYSKAGAVTSLSVLSTYHPHIENLTEILKLRFLLKKEVFEYIRKLPTAMKSFKIATKKNDRTSFVGIRGKVDWVRTTQKRLKYNYYDNNIFQITERKKNYESDENIVLYKALEVLHDLINIESILDKSYSWSSVISEEDKAVLKNIFHQNVFLKKINNKKTISERTLINVSKHRNSLYAESAKLLLLYKRIESSKISKNEILELLRETFIEPESDETLFELYWIIRIIKNVKGEVKLHPIERNKNLVASWVELEKKYLIYHNTIGSGAVNFATSLAEIEESTNSFLIQKKKSHSMYMQYAKEIFCKKTNSHIYNGVPDIMIEVTNKHSGELISIIIGEVKYTNSKEYALEGLKELIDYMHFSKMNNRYLKNTKIKVNGILLLDAIDVSSGDLDDIVVMTTNDLKSKNIFETTFVDR